MSSRRLLLLAVILTLGTPALAQQSRELRGGDLRFGFEYHELLSSYVWRENGDSPVHFRCSVIGLPPPSTGTRFSDCTVSYFSRLRGEEISRSIPRILPGTLRPAPSVKPGLVHFTLICGYSVDAERCYIHN